MSYCHSSSREQCVSVLTHIRRDDRYVGLIRARGTSRREGPGPRDAHTPHQNMKPWKVAHQPGSVAEHLRDGSESFRPAPILHLPLDLSSNPRFEL